MCRAFAQRQSCFADSTNVKAARTMPRRQHRDHDRDHRNGQCWQAIGAGAANAGYDVVFAGQDAGKAETVAEGAGAPLGRRRHARPSRAPTSSCSPCRTPPSRTSRGRSRRSSRARSSSIPTNPLKPDGSGLATAAGTSGAESLAALLPDAKVVKAFNTLFATNTADPTRPRHAARQPVRDRRRGAAQGRRLRPERVDRLPPGARRSAGRVARARGDGLAQHPHADADRRPLEHGRSSKRPRGLTRTRRPGARPTCR